jgi:hypothetical protein
MKFVFTNLGENKIKKIVEIDNVVGFLDVQDLVLCEAELHIPEQWDLPLELVPIDGLVAGLANQYVIVYGGYKGIGNVLIYH